MALGDLTRQLAQQAIGNPVKDAIEALRPPDLSRISEAIRSAKPAAAGPGENLGAAILGQVQAMHKALKEDEELVVLCSAAGEAIRVLECFVPYWNVLVLTGIDTEKNITRVVSPVDSVQLVCKSMKVQPPGKPTRVGFIAPKPRPE